MLPPLSVNALQRHDAWQRCLRQVSGVSLRSLGAPADLFMELRPPLNSVTVQVGLTLHSGRVRIRLTVDAQGPPGSAPSDPPLYRSETAFSTANPCWPLSVETLPPLVGSLRGVRITAKRRAAAGDEIEVVWERIVFFDQLAHLVTELAPPMLLPAGSLLVEFDDG